MPPRILEYVQRGLIAALSVVLALVVFSVFRGVLRTPAGDPFDVTEAGGSPQSTVAVTQPPDDGTGQTPTATVTTTNAPQAFSPPWTEGPCSESAPEAGEDTVLRIYFNCGDEDDPAADTFVYRKVSSTNRVLTNTFRQLVRGPEPNEQSRGFGSFFGEGAIKIESVTLREGRAVIDFTGLDAIRGSFTNQTSVEFFLANLGANAFQFSSVQAVEYRSDDNCTEFWEILGGSSCEVISRSQWLVSVESNR